MIEQLKELLEGATVISVEDAKQRESICRITAEKDGKRYSFTLFATDLGAWVADSVTSEGTFRNFDDFIEKTFMHLSEVEYFSDDIFEAIEDPMKRTLGVKCKKCGQEFKITLTAVKESKYSRFFTSPEGRSKFYRVLSSGLYIMNPEMVDEGIAALK